MNLEHRVELELQIAKRDYYRRIGDPIKAESIEIMIARAIKSLILDRYPWGTK